MPLPEYRMNTLGLGLHELSSIAWEGELLLDPPYQRGDVWTLDQRVNLIRSLLLGVPIASIVLNRRGSNSRWEGSSADAYYATIDGRQRITTAMMWWKGEFAIPSEWLREEFFEANRSYESTVTYPELCRAGQLFMKRGFVIPVAEAALPTVAAEAEVYGLINAAGTQQTEEDLSRARQVQNSLGRPALP
jgi:hypothetical protein